jgi:hypothetical protein
MAVLFSDLLTSLGAKIGLPDPVGTLSAAISSTTATSMTMATQAVPLVNGDIVEIDDELLRVSDVTRGSPNDTFTVDRGVLGSTAATHLIDAPVARYPKYPRWQRKHAINDVLTDWVPTKLPRVQVDTSQTFGATSMIVAIPAAATLVLRVEFKMPGWTWLEKIPHGRPKDYPTALVSTGKGVPLTYPGPAGYTVYTTWAGPWPALAADTDTLPTDWVFDTDLVAWGAAAMLLEGKQNRRATFDAAHVQREEQQTGQVVTLPKVSAQDCLGYYQQLLTDSMQGWPGARPVLYEEC